MSIYAFIKKTRNIGLLTLLLCCTGFLSAQDVFNFPLDAKSLPRYSEICNMISSQPLVKGVFEQTKTIKRLGRSFISKGSFIIAAELGMVWDTISPFPSAIAVGRDFIIQSTGTGTKTKLDAKGNETFISLADTISAIFSGNTRILGDKFSNYFIDNNKTGMWTIGLIPNDNAVRIFADRIVLSGGNKPALINSITIYSQNGDIINYSLSNHYFPVTLSENEKALFSY
jgi:hypothetical protein